MPSNLGGLTIRALSSESGIDGHYPVCAFVLALSVEIVAVLEQHSTRSFAQPSAKVFLPDPLARLETLDNSEPSWGSDVASGTDVQCRKCRVSWAGCVASWSGVIKILTRPSGSRHPIPNNLESSR